MNQFVIMAGEGRYLLEACISLTSGGISVYLYGGDYPHIGSVVLAQPRLSITGSGTSCTSSVINLCGHKEEAFAREMAEKLCIYCNLPVCVCAGIHIDDAGPEDIVCLTDVFHELSDSAARKIGIYFDL